LANFFVNNHRFPRNPQLFTINLSKYATVGGEINPNFSPNYPSAEPYWKIAIFTSGKDSNGKEVGPVIADVLGSFESVNEFIEEKIRTLCQLIDWSSQGTYLPESDVTAPQVEEQTPFPGEENVAITSGIRIVLKDPLPGNGININTLSFKINGIPVSPKITGNKYGYTLQYNPRPLPYE
jgi:hypothetical protein